MQSAGPPPEARKTVLKIDRNFDHFLTSIFDRFGVVLGCHLGVIFDLVGGQVGFQARFFPKNVILQKTSAVWATARFRRSEGPKIDPRRLQDGLEERCF